MSDVISNPSKVYRYVRYRMNVNTDGQSRRIEFLDANEKPMIRRYKNELASQFDIGNLSYVTVIDEILDGAK